jgi:2-keto-4-pentenoate hydratase/2-oxohepta-3-ene-1,7-dioic acid hydratase in catechol pathway
MNSVKSLAPVSPPNIICLGLNYKKYADEAGMPHSSEPLIFLKTTTAVCGPGDPIVLPSYSPDKIDHEAELAIVIQNPQEMSPKKMFSMLFLAIPLQTMQPTGQSSSQTASGCGQKVTIHSVRWAPL